jgi:hypothetical protein
MLLLRRSGTCTCSAIIPDAARALDNGVCANGQSPTSVGLYLTNAGGLPAAPCPSHGAFYLSGLSPSNANLLDLPTAGFSAAVMLVAVAPSLPPGAAEQRPAILRPQRTSPRPADWPRWHSLAKTTPGTCPAGPKSEWLRPPPRIG